jgi:hypothetical protein
MDEDQAAEIHEHLLEAAFAIDEARAAIFTLGKDDQEELAASVEAVEITLHSKLLRTIYSGFPDLREFDEFPEISSALRWDQVRLPPSTSEADVDAVILSVMTPRLQKMALVIGHAVTRCKELAWPISGEALAARVRMLAEAGPLEGEGDLRRWRHSEVRLKG